MDTDMKRFNLHVSDALCAHQQPKGCRTACTVCVAADSFDHAFVQKQLPGPRSAVSFSTIPSTPLGCNIPTSLPRTIC